MSCGWTFAKKADARKDPNLARLIQFYVLECPVPGVSAKGKQFSDYGWSGRSYSTLHKEMRSVGGFPTYRGDDWKTVTVAQVEGALRDINRLDVYDCSFEFAIHTTKSGLNKTEGLFNFIRNSFAHGGFKTSKYEGEVFYVMENRYNGKLRGRGIIRESTLLKWIDVVKRK